MKRNRRGGVAQWLRERRPPPPQQALVAQVFKARPPCFLCGGAFYAVGTYNPPQPQGWQGGEVFGVCITCVDLPDYGAKVEARLRQSRAQAMAPWN